MVFFCCGCGGALTDSMNPTDYLKKMRRRDGGLATYLGTNCLQVEMMTETSKKRRTLAANVQVLFRNFLLSRMMIKSIWL